jgi:hypothetical protein
MGMKKEDIGLESFSSADEAWKVLMKKYQGPWNAGKFDVHRKAGWTLTVKEIKKRYWIVIQPPK